MDSKEFRKWGKEMIDFVADYWENIRDHLPTPDVQPGFMRKLVPDEAPEDPEPWENIFGDLDKVVIKGNTHWQHPHFFAYYQAANSYPAVIGEILSAGLATIGFTWNSGPSCTELEMVVLDWLAKMLKLPKEFLNSDPGPGVGMLQCAASDSTVLAMLAARNNVILNESTGEFDGGKMSKLVAYTSEEAHSSVERAGLLSAVKVRKITTDNEYAMRGSDLEQAIKEDLDKGLIPFFVCATLGTTPSCAFDKLEEIGPICRQYNLFLHVDAAYAGSAFICPEYRHLLNGIEFADSFNFNCHKLMLVNFDCAPTWFKNAKDVERAFLVDPMYLKHAHSGAVTDFRNLQIPLARRFRSLKLWFVLRAYGIKGIQEFIRKHCELAKLFYELAVKDDRFEIPAPLNLGLVCFRLKDNDKTEQLYKLLDEDRRIHLVRCYLKEKCALRFTISSSLTNEDDIKFAWNVITEMAEKLN
jgi:aromatic-L-amino-acid decarboxylase